MSDIIIQSDTATADSIEAAAKAAEHCDTLNFVSVDGKVLRLSRPIDLTGTYQDGNNADGTPRLAAKKLFVKGDGAVLYAGFPLSSVQAMVTWGAPLGMRVGGLTWRGVNVMGSVALQNVSYSRFEPEACDSVILQADSVCSYNHFCYPGCGSAVIVNQLNDSAWCDENKWYDTPLGCSGGQPVIRQVSKTATGPVGLSFYACTHEANGPMVELYNSAGLLWRDCYWEGAWTPGVKGKDCSVQIINCAHSPWTDPTICPCDVNE